MRGNSLSERLARGDQRWADDAPRECRAAEERPRGIESSEHTHPDEGRSPLPDPIPALDRNDPFPAQAVQRPAPVPIPEDTGSVLGDTSQGYRRAEGDNQGIGLLLRIGFRVLPNVQGANGVRGGDGTGEDQLLLEDVELAQGNGKGHAVEGTAESESDQPAEVCLWRGTQETELVRCGEAGGEEQSERAGGGGRRLTADILLGSEVASAKVFGESFGKGLEDGVAKDRAEE